MKTIKLDRMEEVDMRNKCGGTIEGIDGGALDRTAARRDGHRFLLETRYTNGDHDAVCLKCGKRVRLSSDRRILESYA